MVNRYDTHEIMGMIRDDDGLLVQYDDYAALEAERDRLAAVVEWWEVYAEYVCDSSEALHDNAVEAAERVKGGEGEGK